MSHTPTPFCTMYDSTVIRGFDGSNVANVCEFGEQSLNPYGQRDNAAFIVRACNAHDELVAALESAAETIDALVKIGRIPANSKGLRDARAALAKANGGHS